MKGLYGFILPMMKMDAWFSGNSKRMKSFPDGGTLILRLCPEADLDISGVYGMEFYEDRNFFGTEAEINTYGNMLIAIGNVSTMDGTVYSFAVDAEGLDEENFYKIVSFFIESCMNQRSAE